MYNILCIAQKKESVTNGTGVRFTRRTWPGIRLKAMTFDFNLDLVSGFGLSIFHKEVKFKL